MKINECSRPLSDIEIERRAHWKLVGGMWEEIGRLQFNFLVRHGLRKDMRLLDIGCGALRGGVHFVRYLNTGNYFGVDMNKSLLDVGYEKELLPAGLADKLPRSNLLVEKHFAFSRFGVKFDMALALSVFTHLPLNSIYLCLIELAKCMEKGRRFYATFFECSADRPIESEIRHEPCDVITYFDQDPYHYRVGDLLACIRDLPWKLKYIGEWNHPRGQRMVCFVRQ